MLNYYDLTPEMKKIQRWVVVHIFNDEAIAVYPETMDKVNIKCGCGAFWSIGVVKKVALKYKKLYELDLRPAFVDGGGNIRLFKEHIK